MRTVLRHVTEINQIEFEVLTLLTMGDWGSMKRRFRRAHENGDGWAAIHYRPDGSIDGWALMFYDDEALYPIPKDQLVAYFFVDKDSRRQGIGTALMRQCRIASPEPFVCPWDDNSGGFFREQGAIKVEKHNVQSYHLDTEKATAVQW